MTDPLQRENGSNAEDFHTLKKRLHSLEEDNDAMQVKLNQARKHIKRLRAERFILLDRLDEYGQRIPSAHSKSHDAGAHSDSSASGTESLATDIHTTTAKTSSKKARTKQHGQEGNTSAPARKKKDPNAPKGPGNVFFLYCRMERDSIKDQLPTENTGEVTRALAQQWKALNKDEKQKYYDIYKRELKEYEEAMKTYNANGSSSQTNMPATKKEEEEEEDEQGEDDMEVAGDDEPEEEEVDMLQDDDDLDDAPTTTGTTSPAADSNENESKPNPHLPPLSPPFHSNSTPSAVAPSPLSQVQSMSTDNDPLEQ